MLTDHGDGTYTYDPNGRFDYLLPGQDQNGFDMFEYFIDDSHGGMATAMVFIDIMPVNDAPIADANGPYVIDEGDDLVLDGSGSSDPDEVYGDAIVSYAWDLDNDGQYDDTTGAAPTVPWANLTSLGLGTHTIGLQVTDSFGATATDGTTLAIYRNPPVASDDDATVDEGGAVAVDVLANDTDADSMLMYTNVTVISAPVQGTAVVSLSGIDLYARRIREHVGQLHVYRIDDDAGEFDTATVSITITPLNDLPVAEERQLRDGRRHQFWLCSVATGLLANDSDGDPIDRISS